MTGVRRARISRIVPSVVMALLAARGLALPVTFRYKPEAPVQSVSVAGSFNNWSRDADPMKPGAGGVFSTTLDLEPGPYQYKFVVDGRTWIADPKAPGIPPDGNSPLWVYPSGAQAQQKRGDGKLFKDAVKAMPPFRIDKTHVQFKVQTAANDVDLAVLGYDSSANPIGLPVQTKMTRSGSDGMVDTWTVTIPARGAVFYTFGLCDGKKEWLLQRNGLSLMQPQKPADASRDSKPFVLNVAKTPLFQTPAWVRDTVWYQVFPERFYDGDRSNDRMPPVGVADWNTPLTLVPYPNDHYWGGDLQGIIDKLPYLKSLGVTGLYLNPVFLGPDTHKYATTDYMRVDPDFGSTQTLKALVAAAHKDGMRVMLDGVFNHTSVYFFAFQDILKNQQKSRYAKWYRIRKFPVLDPTKNYMGPDERNIPYDAYWGIKWMPRLNPNNPDCAKYLLNVATHWIKECGIDGWRLDVADGVPHEYWKKFREAVKAAKPDAVIIGEIWGNAAPWLQGDEFDGVMNYRFRGILLDFVNGRTDAAQFASRLEGLRAGYPPQANAAMYNLVGSHDTERLRHAVGGDVMADLFAMQFEMVYPGAPSIYYGDENGMTGAGDPWNRAPMEWDEAKWNAGLHATCRAMIALRKAHPALRGDGMETLYAPAGGHVVAFLRSGGGEQAITIHNAANATETVEVPAPGALGRERLVDIVRDGDYVAENGKVRIIMPGWSTSVLVPLAAEKARRETARRS